MLNLKIWRSPASAFGVFQDFIHENEFQYEFYTACDAYTDEELDKISSSGFNAVWIHGRLDYLVSDPVFTEFGSNEQIHYRRLRKLIDRAADHGIKIVLYLQPPRAIYCDDTAFWEKHMALGGEVTEILDGRGRRFQMRSLCTSHIEVRQYLRRAFARLVKMYPELGGIMIISASEYPAHCYSRRNCCPDEKRPFNYPQERVPCLCKLCSKRFPEEVIVDLLDDIRDGIRRSSEDMPILFWNWGWSMYPDKAEEYIMSNMPQDSVLVCDFERGGDMLLEDGRHRAIHEYSLMYSGPSESFKKALAIIRKRGMNIMPKLQIGTTHELASVVSLPLVASLYHKAAFMVKNGLDSYLGCWNFGCYLSFNTKVFNYFLNYKKMKGMEADLLRTAESMFPLGDYEKIVLAWKGFSLAMAYYPFSVYFLYFSSVNYSLGYFMKPGPLTEGAAGRSWLPDKRGDDVSESLIGQNLEEVIRDLVSLSCKWQNALEFYRSGLKEKYDQEYQNAALIGYVWKSTLNYYKIFQLKLNWKQEAMMDYISIIKEELEVVTMAIPILEADKRQGFHIEGHCYLFNVEMLKEKIEQIKNVISLELKRNKGSSTIG